MCLYNTIDTVYFWLFFAVLIEEIKSFLISIHCSRIAESP